MPNSNENSSRKQNQWNPPDSSNSGLNERRNNIDSYPTGERTLRIATKAFSKVKNGLFLLFKKILSAIYYKLLSVYSLIFNNLGPKLFSRSLQSIVTAVL